YRSPIDSTRGCNPSRSTRVRELGEQLDAHRTRQQAAHPTLSMTGMYNVLDKLRSGEPLTTQERTIHEQGLVIVLEQIHDDLDRAVFDAYRWPHDLSDEEILERLVDLNHERAEEESRGLIRWLRPEFQNPQDARRLDLQADEAEEVKAATKKKPAKIEKRLWPKTLPERFQSLRAVLDQTPAPLTAADLAKHFTRARKEDVEELLAVLATLGHVRVTDQGRYVA
ncbi:MAG: class I SAM-dependent DNA methyltransferase, partial [Planctomycetaceae bacterium]